MKESRLWLLFIAGCIVFAILFSIDVHHHYSFKFSCGAFGAIYMLYLIELKRNRGDRIPHIIEEEHYPYTKESGSIREKFRNNIEELSNVLTYERSSE